MIYKNIFLGLASPFGLPAYILANQTLSSLKLFGKYYFFLNYILSRLYGLMCCMFALRHGYFCNFCNVSLMIFQC